MNAAKLPHNIISLTGGSYKRIEERPIEIIADDLEAVYMDPARRHLPSLKWMVVPLLDKASSFWFLAFVDISRKHITYYNPLSEPVRTKPAILVKLRDVCSRWRPRGQWGVSAIHNRVPRGNFDYYDSGLMLCFHMYCLSMHVTSAKEMD